MRPFNPRGRSFLRPCSWTSVNSVLPTGLRRLRFNRSIRQSAASIAATASLLSTPILYAQEPVHPLANLGGNAVNSLTGWNAALHAGAVTATYGLSSGGIDADMHNYFAEHQGANPYTVPAVYMGYIVPVALGSGLWLTGEAGGDRQTLAAGSAVLQASLLAVTYTSMLKAVTGRPNPDPEREPDIDQASREFRFGLLRGGLHYGWPSGHLGTNTAAMVSLAYLFPDAWPVHVAGTAYLSYMAFGVVAHEGATMHWFSDVVAGTMMGYAIGSSVGTGYRSALQPNVDTASSWSVSPLITPDTVGVALSSTL